MDYIDRWPLIILTEAQRKTLFVPLILRQTQMVFVVRT